MKPVWFLRARQLMAKYKFWVAIVGYDPDDKSANAKFYLVYLVIFLGVWGVACMAMLASTVAGALQMISPAAPAIAATLLMAGLMLLWWLWTMFSAAKTSPLRFSAEDATQVCMMPVSRRAVTFAWMLLDWLMNAIPFWGLAFVFGFALTEISLGGVMIWAQLPLFLANGACLFLPVALMQAGMFGFTWALGCLRLNKAQERKFIILFPCLILLLSAVGVWAMLSQNVWQLLLHPLLLPIRTGLMPSSAYMGGISIAFGWMLTGFIALYFAAPNVNLSRAAQESEITNRLQAAMLMGATDVADKIRLQRRLKHGAKPIPLPDMPGVGALLWKRIIQNWRSLRIKDVFAWFLLLSSGLSVLLVTDFWARAIILIFWITRINTRVVGSLRNNLENWQLYRLLPISALHVLLIEVAPVTTGITLLYWLGLALLSAYVPVSLALVIAIPMMMIIFSIVAFNEIISTTKSDKLMHGTVPTPGIFTIIVDMIVIAINYGLAVLINDWLLVILAMVLVNLMLIAVMTRMYLRTHKNMGV